MLPDIFAGHFANDIAPLPNGQVLLAEDRNANLYGANGVFIRTVASLPALTGHFVGQVAVSNDMSDVWLAASGCGFFENALLRFSFDSGLLISQYDIFVNTPNALVIGTINGATSDVPLGSGAMLLLTIVLALAAVAVLRP
jgi:hypothetical protein